MTFEAQRAELQRTADWHRDRLGKVTASRIADVMATVKTGEAVSRRNYRAEKVLERISGVPQDNGYQSYAMKAGIENESKAQAAYCFHADTAVQAVGFIPHPTIPNAGASPDGYVGDDGLIEIKCPEASAYLDALLGKPIPEKYVLQMQFQMAATGRQWCDYIVWRDGLQTVLVRVMRDDKLIAKIEEEVRTFLGEVEDILETLARK
jgi:putative phage-type endonuclease